MFWNRAAKAKPVTYDVKRDPLYERAHTLAGMAHVWAIKASTDLRVGDAECFQNIGDDDKKWWDFFFVVGVMFYTLHTLRLVGRPRCDHLEAVAVSEFERMFARGHEAFMDCAAFFDRTIQGQIESSTPDNRHLAVSDTIGGWIVWNVLERAPKTDDEWQMVRTIGILISQPFSDWWGEQGAR